VFPSLFIFGNVEGHSCSVEGKTIGDFTRDGCTLGGRVGGCTKGLLLLLGGICVFLEGGSVGGRIFGLLFGLYGTCVVADGTLTWFGLVGTVNLGGKGVGGAVMGSR